MAATKGASPQAAGRAVRAEDVAAIVSAPEVALSPDGRLVAYTRVDVDLERDDYRSSLHLVPAEGGEPVRLTQDRGRDSAPRWSPDGRWLAFLSDRDGKPVQLYLLPVGGGEPHRLTKLAGGAGPGEWSPDGSRIVFCARVSKEPPPEDRAARDRWAKRPRVVTRGQYKADGSGYTFDAVSQVFVADVGSGAVAQLTSGDAEHATPAWSPDGGRIAYVRARTGLMDFRLLDAWVMDADGRRARRVSETAGRALAPAWSPDGRTIAFYANDAQDPELGDSMVRVWLASADGGEARPLTAGYDRSVALARQPEATPPPAWSLDGRAVVVPIADSGCVHLARVAVADGTVTTVVGGARQVQTHAAGTHRLAFSATDWQTPADVYACDRDGTRERRLTRLNDAWLAEVALPRVEHRQFAGPHGTLEGWVVHPSDGRRPAPLLVEIHGGPHSYHGNAFPGGALHMFALATRGWAVLALNPTGSGSYGKAFADGIRGRWGEHDLPEQLAAVDALVRDGVADPARLAVSGYSYGGYMTAWTTSHTERFKAAVVGAPVVNVESFHGTSDIGAWFGPREAGGDLVGHREAFRRLSPINYVERVATPTLVVHGEADDRCPVSQGEEWYIGLLAVGRVPAEFIRYPGQSHAFRGSGRPSHRIDLFRRAADWLERYTTADR